MKGNSHIPHKGMRPLSKGMRPLYFFAACAFASAAW